MSGGAFDYAYSRLGGFAEELTIRIAEGSEGLSEETKETLRDVVLDSLRLASMMRAVEWFYSGDISEEEMRKRIKENG